MLNSAALKKVVDQAGYNSTKSLEFLHNLVKTIQPDCILEFGTGYGCSAIFMALALSSPGKIFSVDDHRDEAESIEMPTANLEICGVLDKITLVQGTTFDAPILFSENPIAPEIFFMDSSHNNFDSQREYAVVEAMLPENHVIVIDDLLAADVEAFALWLFRLPKYEFCLTIRHHHGMAILGTSAEKYLQTVVTAYKGVTS